jgi:exodeoxyribonuclease VII large subunit
VRTPLVSAIGHEIDFSISDFVADLRAPTPSAAAELLTPDRIELLQRLRSLKARAQRSLDVPVRRLAQRLDQLELRLAAQAPAARLARFRQRLEDAGQRLRQSRTREQQQRALRLRSLRDRLALGSPERRLSQLRSSLPKSRQQLQRMLLRELERRRQRLQLLARTLAAVSPLNTLGRGYSILLDEASGRVISSVQQSQPGQRLRARLADGEIALRRD